MLASAVVFCKMRGNITKSGGPMKTLRYLCLLTGALMFTACDNNQFIAGGSDQHHTITVTAEASVNRTPDRFMLRATSNRTGDDIADMKSQLDDDIRAALALAVDLGIDEKQLRADSLAVQPEWQWQPTRELIGYRVSRSLTVTSDGLEAHAGMLEGLARLGFTEIQPLGSTLSDPVGAEAEALLDAMNKARSRAELLAEAAQRSLGEALVIREDSGQQVRPMAMMTARAESDDGAWSPGETRVTGRVTVTYRLR